MIIVAAGFAVALLAAAPLFAQTPPPAQPPPKPAPTAPATPKPRATTQPAAANFTLAIMVTDASGGPLGNVDVTITGPLDRSGTTDSNGALRVQGTRAGTYRLRFDAEGYISFEREVTTRAGVRNYDVAVTLNDAPKVEPPPPPPAPEPKAAPLPPPGSPRTLTLLDWLDQNFITNREPQKESVIGCSGLEQALVWQIRDPWSGRQHESADGMFYVIGGEGTLRLGDRDTPVAAGGFAVVPRGTTYSFTRRGRNPLIVLAVLAGAPCAAP
jgi:mannose-6-phosphate isomerase-like protein (cupin superfamily)